jgi:glycosyltransferase involved in cell wall biosynthesis
LSALPGRVVEALSPDATETELIEMAECLAHNFSRGNAEPQLLLDVTELRLTDSQTGIQRVVRSLLLAFLRAPPPGFTVSAVYFDGYRFRHARQFLASFVGLASSEDDVVDFQSGDVYLSLDFTVRTTPQAEGMLKTLSRRGVRLCFIVYDLLPLLHPYWWPDGMGVRYERWLRSLSNVADTVCCISQSVANELGEWMNKSTLVFQYQRPVVRWFHLGADLEQSAPSSGWPQNYAKVLAAMDARPTFLMVGTLEPRKGHSQAVEAFEALWADGHAVNLVIVGKSGWMVDELIERIQSHPENGAKLFWLNGASDECLEDLYGRAICLLAASEGEGFGLPLIEVARRGLPIICRDLPIFREVAGGAAHYFTGREGDDLSASIALWLISHAEGSTPDPSNLDWLTWDQSASQLLEVLGMPKGKAAGNNP